MKRSFLILILGAIIDAASAATFSSETGLSGALALDTNFDDAIAT